MEQVDQKILVSLLDKDPELKRYHEEHLDLEDKLLLFQNRYLTAEQEVEKKKIQKLKLTGKDKIMELLKKYQQH
jgi:uncharacterized protein YdcH (DUF465 family)